MIERTILHARFHYLRFSKLYCLNNNSIFFAHDLIFQKCKVKIIKYYEILMLISFIVADLEADYFMKIVNRIMLNIRNILFLLW